MKPLGKNDGGYFGETIDIEAVLGDCTAAAEKSGWKVLRIPVDEDQRLLALHRAPANAQRRIYLSSGIHGDEPAAPLAMRQLLQEDDWPVDAEIWVCPCLNPTGFSGNTRENAEGMDLNRDYKHLRTPETCTHVAWLETLPNFDFTIQLHEDWEAQGFYHYELNPDSLLTNPQVVIEAVTAVCPIDHSEIIDGRRNLGGVVLPELDPAMRPQWPEAFWLVMNKTRLSFTCEAPSDFPMNVRMEALVAAVRALL